MITKLSSGVTIVAEVTTLLFKILLLWLQAIYEFLLPAKEKSVANETVLITGTGHGIGRELALQFASLGAKVICVDINKDNNDLTVKELKDRGYNRVFSYQCDVSNKQDISILGDTIRKEVGDVTVVVNNAGIMPCHPFSLSTQEEIKRIFDINVFAHFWILQEFLPSMVRNNHGHVVALSSMAGILGLANLVPYCASKFAVRGLMEALSEEFREDPKKSNIKFTTIYPFIVDTGLCKKPKIKYPNLLGIVKPKEAAQHIISAMRRDLKEMTIPSCLLTVNNVCRNFPVSVAYAMKDFLDSGVESHE